MVIQRFACLFQLCATVCYMPKSIKIVTDLIKKYINRRTSANVMMISFILLTSIGAGLIFLPAGLIVAGIGCGLFGFLLGAE